MFQANAIMKDAGHAKHRPWGLIADFSEIETMTKLSLGGRLTVLLPMLALSAYATASGSTVDAADYVDFAELNACAWMTDLPMSEQRAVESDLNPLNEQRIRAALEVELERKGDTYYPGLGLFRPRASMQTVTALLASFPNEVPVGEEANEDLLAPEELTVAADVSKDVHAEIEAATSVDDDQDKVLEEFMIVAKDEWRLPDLGSSWRAAWEAKDKTGRITSEFLPRYDPQQADRPANLFQLSEQEQHAGSIELFRFSFGRRP